MEIVGIVVMLNNYYHDFATAVIIVCTYAMVLMVRFAEREGAGRLFREKIPKIYPRMLHITGGSLALLFMAGIVRSFTYKWFEWVEVLGMGQIVVLIFKHVLIFAIIGYGIYVWVGLHKRVKAIKSEG